MGMNLDGARCSVVGWGNMLQARISRVRSLTRSLNFSVDLILPDTHVPGVDSTTERNECQESSWGVKGELPARKADNLTAICEPVV
jgi:hypothetical protein